MPRISVVLMEPKIEGNVGAVARSMANFGLRDLVLVNPCPIGDEAYKRAKHGVPILKAANIARDLEEAAASADWVVGTTGIPTTREKSFHRQALTPWEFAAKMAPVEGNISLLLGREDYGLYNLELDRMDLLVHIPCNPGYPVLNMSHAAAILFYELYKVLDSPSQVRSREASGFEKELLHRGLDELLSAIRYPEHKRRRTEVMFRRLIGRATPSKWEFHALMGVLRRATKTIRRLSESPGIGPSS